MNKKIILISLLILLLLVGAIGIFFLLSGSNETELTITNSKPSAVAPPAGANEQPLTKKNTQTVLFLFPNPISFTKTQNSASESATVYVQIDTGENEVSHVQLELSYDPKAVSVIRIEPNGPKESFFQNPTVILQLIDPTNGIILYSLEGASTGQKGQGTVATIEFMKNPSATASAPLRFLQKTTTTAKNVSGSSLRTSLGATFLFNGD